MQFEALTVGVLQTNCYLVGCSATRAAVVIDPGGDGERILAAIKKWKLDIKWIILTHVHYDHLAGLEEVQQSTGALVAVHRDDAAALSNSDRNLAAFFSKPPSTIPSADRILHHDDLIEIGNTVLKVIHTPGHTPGGICILDGNDLYSGDTLFAGSIGRSDLPGGDLRTLVNSVKSRLMRLYDGIKVFPGHGESTSIGEERRSNPYLNDWL